MPMALCIQGHFEAVQTMNYTEDTPRAGEYLRLTLALLAKHNLCANPINYTVWYEYVSGKNVKLKQAVDRLILENPPLTNQKIEGVYQAFVTDGDRIVISRLLTKVNLMLREITRHVAETGGDLAGHGQALDNLAGKLRQVDDLDGVKKIVDQMMETTRDIIRSGSRLQNRMEVSSKDLSQLHRELAISQQEARTDALTGLVNRRGLEKQMELERIRARQNNSAFSVILMDVDYFKTVNDTHGHLVGDSLLKGISRILQAQVRKKDMVARFGGEEFLVMLPETGMEGAYAVAEKIRRALAQKEWSIKESGRRIGRITASMGIALYDLSETDIGVIHRADAALYKAKSGGRNQVVVQPALAN